MNTNISIYQNYLERSRIDWQAEEVNLHVARALQYVIDNVFIQLSVNLALTISSRNRGTTLWFDYMLEHLDPSSFRGITIQLQRYQLEKLIRVPGRKYCNLLLVDSYEALLATNLADDNALYDGHEYYFIFLQTRDRLIPREMQLILDHCLANYWLNCNIMIQTAEADVLVYSYYPYTTEHCQTARPVLINRFDGQRMTCDTMFPDKLTQLHGCPISLLTWHIPPFVELSWDQQKQQLKATGLEMFIVEHLANWMNFSVVLKNVTLQPVSEYRLANGSKLGPIEMMMRRQANLSVGYFRKTARRNLLLTTPLAHYYSPLVATIDLDNYRFSSLAILTFPFAWSIWLVLILAVTLNYFIYLWHWRGVGLEVLEVLLGSSLAQLPSSWMQRIIYAHWLYACIPLRICYQSLLFHLIRFQLFNSVPSSFEELLTGDFHALCTSHTLQMMQEMPLVASKLDKFEGLTTSFDQEVLDVLHERQHEGKVFAIAGQDVTRAHLRETNRWDKYHMLTYYIYVQLVGIYMPKHSYFYEKIDDAIRRLEASGFTSAWRRVTFDQKMAIRKKKEQEQKRLYLDNAQLFGVYKLMAGLYGLASLVLGGELWWNHHFPAH